MTRQKIPQPPLLEPEEPVWTYRGYRLKTSEFVTAMTHFFRAEVQRANVWRQRLDTTTNWAVVATGATLSIAFGQASVHHSVILLNTLLVLWFLLIEARRYRYYELWSYRVRLMETDFYAAMLVPPFHPSPGWAESLAENLLMPHFPISIWEAFAAAGAGVRRYYQQRGQLSTERPLLDDNGDGIGREAATPGEDGSLASRTYLDEASPNAPPTDEVLLNMLQKRAALEAEVDELKVKKAFMQPAEYEAEFERIMIELARISRDIRQRTKT